uniref:Cilia- and flagella-associated protein 206 n=1 Tax=Chromera velia CCMP2878 TaxID=1169474 RepID=A0A0G4EZJ4_9ALVE|eukprot:Cvel_2544.t1-p1 / transcript=Cvel_2544.t1 / gene=Cvel_2544 / organism=Chromera_velia_CCMP2878 / gene_product=UPF0704 protein C6orf165 homolog, putative / transcript_product=UPF0704 protein C6orf165 homolog, putative / location=Cvel_scaffold100:87616-93276(-) / protein_length=585 / sequence_SO=supercontig / SO=protein_coding / is_pseudo=false
MIIGLAAITREIVIACRQIGQAVSETYAAFIASTILNPASGTFYVDKGLDETEARALVEAAVRKIFSRNNPALETLRLQAVYDSAFLDESRRLMKEARQREEQQSALTSEISEAFIDSATKTVADDFDNLAALYRKVFHLLLLKCGAIEQATQPKNAAIEREVAAALESVFPRVGLRPFIALSPAERVAQLSELASIVLGIRLYNQKIRKGGAGLRPLDDKVLEDGSELEGLLRSETDTVSAVCSSYSDVVLYAPLLKDKLDAPKLDKLRKELAYCRQLLAYLVSLQDDLASARQKLQTAHTELEEELARVDASVADKQTVPKEIVYPMFDNAARLYQTAIASLQWLQSRRTLFERLRNHRNEYFPSPAQELVESARAAKANNSPETIPLPDEPPLGFVPEEGTVQDVEEPVLITEDNTQDFLHLPLDFQGRFCVFHHDKAKDEFLARPERYFIGIRSSLLNILQRAADVDGAVLAMPLQADAATITPTHFVEKHRDRTYEWNEWELRKQALQWADIRGRSTKDSQTVLSNFRRENETQVWLKKHEATSTPQEVGTNPPVMKRYLRGLRGEYNLKPRIVDICFEL